jgi:hypothetical protein
VSSTLSTILIAVIISTPPTIAAVAAFLIARRTSNQINEVHLMINSRLDALLKSASLASFAEGREEGRIGKVAAASEKRSRQSTADIKSRAAVAEAKTHEDPPKRKSARKKPMTAPEPTADP